MNETRKSLILPEGHTLTSVKGRSWMGQFSDGSICEVTSMPRRGQNYVELILPSGLVEPPQEHCPLTERGLLMAMQIATIRSQHGRVIQQ